MTSFNDFAPFGESTIFFYHSVNSAIFSNHSLTYATVLHQKAAFFGLMFSVGVEESSLASSFLLSDWLSSSTRASKSSTYEMQ